MKQVSTVGDLMKFSKKNNLHKKFRRSTEEIMKKVDEELWGLNNIEFVK